MLTFGHLAGRVWLGEVPIGRGVPFGRIDPVEDAVHPVGAGLHDTFQPHAKFLAADFSGISRADGGDGIGRLHSGFQKTHAAIGFHAID